jgi:hypothetical protein
LRSLELATGLLFWNEAIMLASEGMPFSIGKLFICGGRELLCCGGVDLIAAVTSIEE